MAWLRKLSTDLMDIDTVRWLIKRPFFQFLLVAPSLIIFIVAAISIVIGVKNPAFNFGMVFTWVVWWGILILLFVIVGRGWCLMCPFGALGEWVQRLSPWWKRKWVLGFNFNFPRRLRNLWLGIAIFVGFIFLDSGYGVSNNPMLTTGLIVVLILGAMWVNLFFKRRTFCQYLCPLTVFIGTSSLLAPFEVRRKDAETCRKCETKSCFQGSENAYDCPMNLRHCDFNVDDRGYPPCRIACPAKVNTSGYIGLTAQGKYREAVELHREATPLVGVLGRICTHPCESACERGKADGSLSVQYIKRFMADRVAEMGEERPSAVKPTRKEKVAIIGSGPAGLSCAYDLLMRGYPVTVFEAAPQAGGLLRYGIPDHRLPKAVLDRELGYMVQRGVEIRTNTRVRDLEELFSQGYRAIFYGTGAGRSLGLGIPNENAGGVIDSLSLLRQVNSGKSVKLGRRVVVVGGGNAAVDSARVVQRLGAVDAARMAQRSGAREVSILYRRTRAEMPAIGSEVEEAEREGVRMHFLVSPVAVLVDNGRVTGLRCVRMELGELDDTGRYRPVPISGSEFDIEVDNVIVAIGQTADRDGLPGTFRFTDWGTLAVDPETMQTDVRGVFACGDVVTGPASVIEAIAGGKEAAISIDRYLRGKDLKKNRRWMLKEALEIPKESSASPMRSKMPLLPVEARQTAPFAEIEQGLDEAAATEEGKRCWNCGESRPLESNHECILCTECIKACPHDNIKMRFRQWGQDLWSRARGHLDESVAAIIIGGLVTVVSLFLVLFLPPVRAMMSGILPAGTPPNDWPRLASVGLVYLSGIAVTLALMYGFSYLSKSFSGAKNISTKTFFIHFGYVVLPLGIMKFISDILDHAFRTWGAIGDVIQALAQDFPFNRVVPGEVTIRQLMSADQTFVLQLVLVSIGFVLSLYAAHRLAWRMFSERDTAFRAFLPIGAFIFILGMAGLWALSAAL